MDKTPIIERFSNMLRFETYSHDNDDPAKAKPFEELSEYLEKAFPNVHRVMSRQVIPGGSLMYRWAANNPTGMPYGILAHLDVVPVERPDEWTHPAFSGHCDGTTFWGRGASDDKCAAGASLEACEALIVEGFEPTRDIYLLYGHNEEDINCKQSGARLMADILNERGVELDFVWDEGGAVLLGPPPGLIKASTLKGLAEIGFTAM